MINEEDVNRSHVAWLVNDVSRLCRSVLVHICRVINGVSHNLAQLGRLQVKTKVSLDEIRIAYIRSILFFPAQKKNVHEWNTFKHCVPNNPYSTQKKKPYS